MPVYDSIASVYDNINAEIDYSAWADFIENCFKKYLNAKPELVLDLACGTGSMTFELQSRGYDMIGADISEDMLTEALDKAYERNVEGILFLRQDMRNFELYGTVGAICSCLDSINYLTEDGDLEKTFSCVHNYLIPGGLFIFDISSEYKFKEIYANNSFLYNGEIEGYKYFCAWQNMYDTESEICEFSLTAFTQTEKGTYLRADELQYQRMYRTEYVKELLCKCGFRIRKICGATDGRELSDSDERIFFVAECIKE